MAKLEATPIGLLHQYRLQSFCCSGLFQAVFLRKRLRCRSKNRICLSTPQKGLGWKFGFASLHVPFQSLSEIRDSLGVNKCKVLFS
ncbi:hypothetical protein [Treponema pedis]|uniref:hypothetical protein n=1 Tax=Treponema pedis TaxID=409322 RepID=UPI0019809D9E|nr:hypothetical protein [Treponema pedis]